MVKINPMRIVTNNLKSLGSRKNKDIIKYPIGEWYFLPEKDIEENGGNGDFGLWRRKHRNP